MKISEAFDAYKKVMIMKGYSRRVVEHHDYVKKRIIKKIGDKELKDFTLDDIFDWRDTMKTRKLPNGEIVERAPNSIRCDMQRLKALIKYMYITGEECINYQLVPVPKHECVERCFLYECEVQAMIDNAYSLRNKFVVSLLYSSGIRLSELISLNRESIVNRTFTVIGKGKKMRICFIDERTEKIMNEYLATRNDDCPALIVSELYKQRMTPTNIQLLIRNSAERAGIKKPVTPHILRHSFATNFLRAGGNIRYLSRMLGHSSMNTTLIYTHIVDNELYDQYCAFHTV